MSEVRGGVGVRQGRKSGIAKRGLEIGPGGNSVVLDKPENIMRLSVVIFDALAFCQDDGNFKRERGGKGKVVER